ncbi:mediator complex, subunit Med7 [Schizophyllum amplum]|uniref:Mediator of RNA polymerase II transcription subunit 7 n=1 Tax=Schizophyllum amplum TaxID=97359 RepID=A0A550CMD9_9AGAR|nr:mediator complex, subunit Med7 [Auriculariopsis ampla]
MLDDGEDAELQNPFPAPPAHYVRYTAHNLKLQALLKERRQTDEAADVAKVSEGATVPPIEDPTQAVGAQSRLLSDQPDLPDFPLYQLEKPRVDWIEEDDAFTVFGETWPIKNSKLMSLADAGIPQLFPEDPSQDRRPAMLSILRSLLVQYSRLTKSITIPPPRDLPEGLLSQNLMATANELRPVQARWNLELMMKRQLELRREETANIHSKCDEIEARLAPSSRQHNICKHSLHHMCVYRASYHSHAHPL